MESIMMDESMEKVVIERLAVVIVCLEVRCRMFRGGYTVLSSLL